ncbi:MAG: YceI family protein [Actinomycetaceae bacterium]|nr:YceI family protein [Arcanobacterium sp.]MDD7687053.1 YceI family protein [Actinomycetaceae bacterium]MDY5273289.1 YceI family protein [Arcanobacterium sp.]
MTSLKDINGTYMIDPSHSRLGFIARHAMITKVRGAFTDFEGTASGNGADPSAAHVEVTAKAASIDTGSKMRDNHLRSGDFFDVEKYPEVKFVSTNVAVVDDETLEITGDLTIRDQTRSLTIPFDFTGAITDGFGNKRIGFEGTLPISRKEFGLTWNKAVEAGGVTVGDKVMLEIEISAIEQE